MLVAPSAILFAGCATYSVIEDARNPRPSDAAPWANYLLLPVTVPFDIATSPIQIPAFLRLSDGTHDRGVILELGTNSPVKP
jgi:hypothetical protein